MASIRKSNNNAKRKQRRLNHKTPGSPAPCANWSRWKFQNLAKWRRSQIIKGLVFNATKENPFYRYT